MGEYKKRSGNRSRYESPIMWADFNAKNYCRAKTFNISENGMYFVTDCAPETKANIRIKPLKYLQNENGPQVYKFYEAKVKWFRDLANMDEPLVGVGVQFLVKSQTVDGPDHLCGLCEENIPYGKIYLADDFVYLCPHCFEHFKTLPDGAIKKNIKDFLIGNVI